MLRSDLPEHWLAKYFCTYSNWTFWCSCNQNRRNIISLTPSAISAINSSGFASAKENSAACFPPWTVETTVGNGGLCKPETGKRLTNYSELCMREFILKSAKKATIIAAGWSDNRRSTPIGAMFVDEEPWPWKSNTHCTQLPKESIFQVGSGIFEPPQSWVSVAWVPAVMAFFPHIFF